MTSPDRIRIALVGLTAKPGAYAWANNVHLPYLLSNPRFQITAVLGSTKQAAEAAISKFSLPSSVRAYGSPEELANDTSVDLVSVVVKAHAHRDIVVPSILKGKDIFVEWPLDVDYKGTREIQRMAEEKGVKSVIGLQGRYSRIVERLAELVKSGKTGRVLSTTVVGTVPTGDGISERNSVKYSLSAGSGATMLDVHFAHFIEGFCHVLGELKTISCILSTQHPTTSIVDDLSGEILEHEYPKTAPDQILMQGILESGAVASFHMRGGSSIGGGLRWLIHGEKGEIEVTGAALLLHINMPVPWKVKVRDADGAVVEEDIVEAEEGQPAVGRLWDAFLEGKKGSYPDFEHAVRRHEIVHGMYDSAREGKMVTL